jgi:hypothetical protein
MKKEDVMNTLIHPIKRLYMLLGLMYMIAGINGIYHPTSMPYNISPILVMILGLGLLMLSFCDIYFNLQSK